MRRREPIALPAVHPRPATLYPASAALPVGSPEPVVAPAARQRPAVVAPAVPQPLPVAQTVSPVRRRPAAVSEAAPPAPIVVQARPRAAVVAPAVAQPAAVVPMAPVVASVAPASLVSPPVAAPTSTHSAPAASSSRQRSSVVEPVVSHDDEIEELDDFVEIDQVIDDDDDVEVSAAPRERGAVGTRKRRAGGGESSGRKRSHIDPASVVPRKGVNPCILCVKTMYRLRLEGGDPHHCVTPVGCAVCVGCRNNGKSCFRVSPALLPRYAVANLA